VPAVPAGTESSPARTPAGAEQSDDDTIAAIAGAHRCESALSEIGPARGWDASTVAIVEGDTADVVAHYEASLEENRLAEGLSALELVRTQEILRRHLPAAPARVLDAGGGTGVHAEWLLADGYSVHLLDITPRHVEQAMTTLGARGLTAEQGDARQLSLPDGSFDVVLVLGPLYHLHERGDRIQVLDEARRVARHGGVVAAAAISRFASLFDGLVREFLFDPEFREIVERDLTDGRHANPERRPHWFTTAYFHRPEQLAEEISSAGLSLVELVGVEGLAGWLPRLDQRWVNDSDRDVILRATRLIESEPALLGLSAHLLAIARQAST
jgi:ubiquinone/menaquinone biosynthesis C-methylase UbiE